MKMSKHVLNDRMDRLVEIAMTIGFGEVIFTEYKEDKRECITDTGVLLVKALNSEMLITGYIARMDKVVAMFRNAGKEIPVSLRNKVKKNQKYLSKKP